jgi:putative aldouronate transport system substrate-binding protein
MMYPIPTLNGERVTQFGTGGANKFFCVTQACENPEALLKMLEFCMTIRYLGTPEEFERLMFNADGFEMWSMSPFRNISPSDYDMYRGLLVADGLAKGLTLEEFNPICKAQYANALKAMNGDRSGLPHYFAYAIAGPLYSDLLKNGNLYQGYMGPLTENMNLYQQSINEALNSAAVKVIMGEDISVYEKAVETWYAAGGQAITDEVNAYYASLK